MNYFFEDYGLDPGRRELRRGVNLIAAEPQVFDLLEYLIRHRERVVGRTIYWPRSGTGGSFRNQR